MEKVNKRLTCGLRRHTAAECAHLEATHLYKQLTRGESGERQSYAGLHEFFRVPTEENRQQSAIVQDVAQRDRRNNHSTSAENLRGASSST